jgi:hypothetical protein
VRIRKNLRVVADAFATSEQRELVRHRASRVDIQTLDCASFHELLASLFQVITNVQNDQLQLSDPRVVFEMLLFSLNTDGNYLYVLVFIG